MWMDCQICAPMQHLASSELCRWDIGAIEPFDAQRGAYIAFNGRPGLCRFTMLLSYRN